MSLRPIMLLTARSIYLFDDDNQVMRISRDESARHYTDYVTGMRNGEWYRVTRRPDAPQYDYDTDSFGRVTFEYETDQGESERITTSAIVTYESLSSEGQYADTYWQVHREAARCKDFVLRFVREELLALVVNASGKADLTSTGLYDTATAIMREFGFSCYDDARRVVQYVVENNAVISVSLSETDPLDELRQRLTQ